MHSGHRARVKKEFMENGLDHFPPHKILEMLLFYSIPRRDTNEIGHKLIKRFGSISGVFNAPINLLVETEGLGIESATLIKFVSDLIAIYMNDYTIQNNVINNYESAKEYMRHVFVGEASEAVYIVCLAHNGRVVFSDTLFKGSPGMVEINTVDIIRTAINTSAVKVVLAHNHPHGISTPSRTDLVTTNILYSELKRINIELLDHIVVANDGVYSMKENGLIPD